MEFVGLPECRINLSQAATYLALAPKSNAAYKAIDAALDDVRRRGQPAAAAAPARRELPRREGTRARRWATSTRTRTAAGSTQQYLPDKLSGRRYYVPIRGVELEMAARLAEEQAGGGPAKRTADVE